MTESERARDGMSGASGASGASGPSGPSGTPGATDASRQPADRPSTAGWNWPPILILGRDTCEDTTRSRRHLEERGIPYEYARVDREPAADEWIRSLNDDMWVTPTILIGDPRSPSQILREPSDEELDEAISGGRGEDR